MYSSRSLWFSGRSMALGALIVIGASVSFVLAARAESGPAVTTVIQNNSNSTISSAPLGTLVHAQAAVASSSASTTPTGTVDFNVYPNMSCSGSSTVQAGVALVSGVAVSSSTAVGASGLSYKVHYNGDSTFATSDGQCVVLAPTATPIVQMSLSTTSALTGTFVHGLATLGSSTANAGGTVAYTVYTNSACTTGAQSAGVKTVSGAILPDSDSIQFNAPGSFFWRAVYSGDASNAAATSSCTGVTITTVPVVPTTGSITVDQVTIPSTDTTSFHFNTTGTGYSAFDLTSQAAANSQTLSPGSYTITQASTTGFSLTSATCALNGAAATTYVPGSTLTLGAGQTITCTFIDTAISTTTNGNHGDNDGDDNDDNDNGGGEGHGIGQFIHDFIKSRFENGHDNGNHFGEQKNGHNSKHKGEGSENDND